MADSASSKINPPLLYGRHAVLEALRAGRRRIQRFYLGAGVRSAPIVADILAAARLRGCPVIEAPRQMLERPARSTTRESSRRPRRIPTWSWTTCYLFQTTRST